MQIFKFTFGPDDIGFIWGPNGSTIGQAKAVVGLNPIKVEKVNKTDRVLDAPLGNGWYFG